MLQYNALESSWLTIVVIQSSPEDTQTNKVYGLSSFSMFAYVVFELKL